MSAALPEPEDVQEARRRYLADARREGWREQYRAAFAAQVDYGKWLTGSLVIIHGGALVGMAQASELAKPLLAASATWFVCGLIAALLSGQCAWMNFSANMDVYEDWSDPQFVVNTSKRPTMPLRHRILIPLTGYVSILAGLISACCILGGATAIRDVLAEDMPANVTAPEQLTETANQL